MATITKQIITGQTASQEMSITDGKGSSVVTVTWQVETSSYADQGVDCVEAFPVKRGMVYNVDNVRRETLICTKVTAKKVNLNSQTPQPTSVFEVNVEYSGIQSSMPDPPEPYSPTFSLSMGVQTGQEAILYDSSNNLIANSAGDLFDTPAIAETEMASFSITRSEYVNPISKQREYGDKYGVVNSAAIWGYAARTLRLVITSDYSSDSGWTVSYNFRYNSDTWDIQLTDRGFNYMTGTGTNRVKRKAVVDENGEPVPVHEPVALDGSGNITSSQNAAIIRRRRCAEKDFGTLGLPDITGV